MQKSVPWMKDTGSKFSRPEKVVVDPFAGNFGTAKGSIRLLQHRQIMGCEINTDWFNLPYNFLVETFRGRFYTKTRT